MEDRFLKGLKSFANKIGEASIRMGKADDRVKIGGAEVSVDQKGFEPLPG